MEPEEVKELKEKIDKAGTDSGKVREVLVGGVKGLGEKGEGKFVEFA